MQQPQIFLCQIRVNHCLCKVRNVYQTHNYFEDHDQTKLTCRDTNSSSQTLVLSIALITPRKWKGSFLRKMAKIVEISVTKYMSPLQELLKRRTKIENHPIGRLGRPRFFYYSSCKNADWWSNHFNTVWKAPPYSRIESISLRFMNHYLHCLFYAWILSEEQQTKFHRHPTKTISSTDIFIFVERTPLITASPPKQIDIPRVQRFTKEKNREIVVKGVLSAKSIIFIDEMVLDWCRWNLVCYSSDKIQA